MMSRRSIRWASVVTFLGLAGITAGLSGQGAGQPSIKNGEWPAYTAEYPRHQVFTALNGKQYIVVAVSGGNYSGEYLAFTLPSKE